VKGSFLDDVGLKTQYPQLPKLLGGDGAAAAPLVVDAKTGKWAFFTGPPLRGFKGEAADGVHYPLVNDCCYIAVRHNRIFSETPYHEIEHFRRQVSGLAGKSVDPRKNYDAYRLTPDELAASSVEETALRHLRYDNGHHPYIERAAIANAGDQLLNAARRMRNE